jgi:hypothetical protein
MKNYDKLVKRILKEELLKEMVWYTNKEDVNDDIDYFLHHNSDKTVISVLMRYLQMSCQIDKFDTFLNVHVYGKR